MPKKNTSTDKRVAQFSTPRPTGFTLIELLVVMAIIAILAAMLLPAIHKLQQGAKVKRAQVQIGQLVLAIGEYHSEYNRFPVSSNVMAAAATSTEDYTYGLDYLKTTGLTGYPAFYSTTASNNSEVISILMDIEKYPVNGGATANFGHIANPQRNRFLSALQVGDDVSPGVGTDLVYRDPWGAPYIITLDLNYDEKTRDAFYSHPQVSSGSPPGPGFNGLASRSLSNGFVYEANNAIMVWSLGPDKKCQDLTLANQPPNKDNVLSWK